MSQPCKTLAVMDEAARKEYWASLALRHCRGLGARSAARLARHFGSAYAAVQAIVDGIKATGSDDPEQVAKWLHANTVKTPVGELKWTAQGDLESYPYVVYTWHKDGSKTLSK